MANLTFKEVVLAVSKLTPVEKAALARTLHVSGTSSLTREDIIAELSLLQEAGVFEQVESLRNKYASPAADKVSGEELRAAIRDAAAKWEQELDGFYADNA